MTQDYPKMISERHHYRRKYKYVDWTVLLIWGCGRRWPLGWPSCMLLPRVLGTRDAP